MTQPDLTDADLARLYRRRVAGRATGDRCVPPEAILALLRRDGEEPERLAVLDHVMACRACHREYRWIAAVEGAAGRRPWWRRPSLALAASLAAALATGLVLQFRPGPAPEPLRGATGDIAQVAPADGAVGLGPITLTWRPAPGARGYVVELLRSDGSLAVSDTTADTTLTLSPADPRLAPAEYLWWVHELTDSGAPRSSTFRTLRAGR